MSRADRIFLRLIIAAALAAAFFAVPLAITLFPRELQTLLHGSGELGLACAAAIYAIGSQLPPLGVAVLALALASGLAAARKFARTLARTRAVLRRARSTPIPPRLARVTARMGLTGAVVCVADPRRYAYTAGLLQPRICISTGAAGCLGRHELEAVLAHEAEHLRRRDPLRLIVVRVLAAALFALPWMRELAAHFEVAAELDADRSAIATSSAQPLAGALYKLARTPFPPAQLAVGAWSPSRARIDQLCGVRDEELLPRASTRARGLTVASLILALSLGFGQAARANLLPASALDRVIAGMDARVHVCPVPAEGVLL